MKNYTVFTKKYALILPVLFFIGVINSQLFAEPPNPTGAKQYAKTFFKTNAPRFAPGKAIKTPVLEQRYQSSANKQTQVFVFQNSTEGFVIVAQNQENFALLGYSQQGKFDTENIPPQLQTLLQLYEDSVQILSPQKILSGTPVMTPLLDEAGISLNQYRHEEAGNCPTGCVATAFAQIMAYYKYPSSGQGSHCYTHSTYGQLCADFGNTIYNWNNPTDADYKKLSFHVGIAMDMNYCGDMYGSIPSTPDYPSAMKKYFKYYLNTGSQELFYMRNEIDQRRPVYAELRGYPGHAVVLDGYDTDGLFHINFGWGGNHNGYFVLNNDSTFYVGGNKFGTNISNPVYLSTTPLKINAQDSLALVAVHNDLNATTGWDLTKSVFTWEGVTIMNNRVIELSLSKINQNAIKGKISPEIGKLTALRKLTMIGQFDGTLPSSITNLTELGHFLIGGIPEDRPERLKINLPTDIGKLAKLEFLTISTYIDGKIPASIGQLTNLRTLNLTGGNLTGNIPSEIGNLKNLIELNLKNNKLSGSIPARIGNLEQLTKLDLSENQLTGTFPSEITQLTKLTALFLNNNKLTGSLPQNIGSFAPLQDIRLYNNQFSGAIPASIGNLNLFFRELDLSSNHFTSLPHEIGNMTNLKLLNVSNNQLTSLPESMANLTNLHELNAANNSIAILPPGFGFFPKLSVINLYNNKLTEIPDVLCELPNLTDMVFSNNRIEKFPPSIGLLSSKSHLTLALDNNEISGNIPKSLLEKGNTTLFLKKNRFTFEDIPVSDKLQNKVDNQKPVKLTKNQFKTRMEDIIRVDIREIAPFTLETNEYYWHSVENNKALTTSSNPILTVSIDDKSINNRYYCVVKNPNSPTYTYKAFGNTYTLPCLESVSTDTISFRLASEEELISEKHGGSYVVSSNNLPQKTVEDQIVTLVTPLKVRGNIQWQASADGKTWHDLSAGMTETDLKANFVSVQQNELVLSPKTPAFYRCSVQDVNCKPLYSDTIKVNPFGNVLYDGTLNVSAEEKTIALDSIEVTLPKGLHDTDFRLTIVKLDNPPAAPAGVKMSSAYDITVSFGSVFDKPIQVKLKNIDKQKITNKNLPTFKPGYFDEKSREWVMYESGGVVLSDSTVFFLTNHLTKLAWFEFAHGSFTHILSGKNVDVIYKWGTDSGEENNFFGYELSNRGKPKNAWYNSNTDPDKGGNPELVQDVAGYLDSIIVAFQRKGLRTPMLKFNVYVSNLGGDGAFGEINVFGYMAGRGYFKINSALAVERDELQRTLAHEYMHYTQDYYMTVLLDNSFFMEAHAPTAARLVWNVAQLDRAEPEVLLEAALLEKTESGNLFRSIFDLLAEPWDNATAMPIVEKIMTNTVEANLSSSFLHYMQNYRESSKLDMATILKNHGLFASASTWRGYLNNQTRSLLGYSLGELYDEYVRYLLSGKNEKFTVLNKGEGNPYTYVIRNMTPENMGTFAQRMVYNFPKTVNESQNDEIELKVPYLASKLYMLYNQAEDRSVIVNYKRLHEKDKDFKVYYGKYDFDSKETTFIDISDSTSYNFLIDSRTVKSVKETQNIGFLLFVNRKCPDALSWDTDFNALFELKATPVLDIHHYASLQIGGGPFGTVPACNFSNGQKQVFIVAGAYDPDKITQYDKRFINDSTYIVDFTFQNITYWRPGEYGNSRFESIDERICKIEYNYVADKMTLHSRYERKFYLNTDAFGELIPCRVTNSSVDIAYIELKDVLKNMTVITQDAEKGKIELHVNNVEQIKDVIQGLSLNGTSTFYYYNSEGEPTSTNVQNYSFVNIDYATSELKIRLILWVN